MGSQRTLDSPWPSQTPTPSTSYAHSKLRKKRDISVNRRPESSLASRQTGDSSVIGMSFKNLRFATPCLISGCFAAQAQQKCQYYSGNNVISCFPTSDVIVPQHQYAAFVCECRRFLSFSFFPPHCQWLIVFWWFYREQPTSGTHANESSWHLCLPRRLATTIHTLSWCR